jgi:hypothetical protein
MSERRLYFARDLKTPFCKGHSSEVCLNYLRFHWFKIELLLFTHVCFALSDRLLKWSKKDEFYTSFQVTLLTPIIKLILITINNILCFLF